MNIGIIAPSNTNPYAAALIARLVAMGHTPSAVICTEPSRVDTLLDYLQANGARATLRCTLQYYRLSKPVDSDVREYLREYMTTEGVEDWDRPLAELCRRWSIDDHATTSANALDAVRYVQSHRLDLLLNTGAEILRSNIIRSARIGILNAHMARLPAFRGMNVLEWSLLAGQQIGVTLHLIDEGVDTGNVLLFREIPIAGGDTIDSLRSKAIVVNIDLMAEGVTLLETNGIEPARPSSAVGKQYYVMHPRLRAVAERRLCNMGLTDLKHDDLAHSSTP